jgi:hypothetical protein
LNAKSEKRHLAYGLLLFKTYDQLCFANTHTHAYTNVLAHLYIYKDLQAHTHTHTHTYTHTNTHTYTYTTRRRGLIAKAAKSPTGLLLTTYDQLRLHRNLLLPVRPGSATQCSIQTCCTQSLLHTMLVAHKRVVFNTQRLLQIYVAHNPCCTRCMLHTKELCSIRSVHYEYMLHTMHVAHDACCTQKTRVQYTAFITNICCTQFLLHTMHVAHKRAVFNTQRSIHRVQCMLHANEPWCTCNATVHLCALDENALP